MSRVASLRVSLLVSLGLVSPACGGNTSGHVADGNAASGAGGNASGGPMTGSSGARPIGGQATTLGGAGGTGAKGIPQCTSPETSPETGLVSCAEGYSHRPVAVECSVSGGASGDAEGGEGNTAEPALPRVGLDTVPCTGAGDCKQFELGFCDGSYGFPVCNSGCIQDADCPAGNICICGGPSLHGGECHPSSCTSDADCGDGSRCASADVACGPNAFACQAAKDECVTAKDCDGAPCMFDPEKSARACVNVECGRPFLVETKARMAPVVTSRAWVIDAVARPNVDHLSLNERARLAEQWAHMGRMEHASIAAFARFSLQLLALGAPPELVDGCTRALADETAHTKLCFAFASTYAGRPLGPGPLDIARSLDVTALRDVVDLVIAEGCFGETSAALEALEAADGAEDPAVVAAYTLIAEDEQRHAELAFRFVRWALAQDLHAVHERVELAIEERAPRADEAARAVAVPCLLALLESARSAVEGSRAA